MPSASGVILVLGSIGLFCFLAAALWLWANNPPPRKPTPAELEARAREQLAEMRRLHAGPFEAPAIEWELPQWRSQWRPRRPFNHEDHLL